MAELKIRGLPDDIYVLLQEQAKRKNLSANAYARSIIEYSVTAGIPAISALLPGTIEYTIRSVMRQDTERLLAYTDAQTRVLQDAISVLKQFLPSEKSDATSDVTCYTGDVNSDVTPLDSDATYDVTW